ncbi:FHA domain-containing protein [Ectothiorhodospira lacustris]|uniref:FHA domain-containing protein n=1 Tax=Ectothiorhodospira lacustris TaxID=2899127 RepID=UPI001EE892DE|nr:FHA domain-containing protein [Ectothiorhodospira lacustris]MCG5500729.1 FHA domain-containing protein [Ectothiorhodospira lacustris]
MDLRRKGERRRYERRPNYPFRDSFGEWVISNRRRLVDRRAGEISEDQEYVPSPSPSPITQPKPSRPGEKSSGGSGGSLLLHYRDAVVNLHPSDDGFLMGRNRQCDLVVPKEFVSRRHARVECRNGGFVLVDQSLNGTYLQDKTGEVRFIHQDDAPLTGSGYLSLGSPLTENADNLVYFYCRENALVT